jgi:hypothetical protein
VVGFLEELGLRVAESELELFIGGQVGKWWQIKKASRALKFCPSGERKTVVTKLGEAKA